MLRQSSALSSAPGSRGSDDNQNFGGGLDGVSCLVIGKSIPVCAPPRKPSKDHPKARRIPPKTRSDESQRRLFEKKKKRDCTFSFVALIQQPVWLSSCSLGTTAPRGCGASGRRAHNTRSHTQTHTHTHERQIVRQRHIPIKSRECQCRNITTRRVCGQQLIWKILFKPISGPFPHSRAHKWSPDVPPLHFLSPNRSQHEPESTLFSTHPGSVSLESSGQLQMRIYSSVTV